ncbi:MAG: hypothetical protein HY22_00145 [[Candidatus Thermochlorobacteriaceae] bacterium GBChlB]|nr:MAG: hypothetical protein HY22_00145 [[Candidatus Thermochlorobacteriaceae] bacterium GBChlB]
MLDTYSNILKYHLIKKNTFALRERLFGSRLSNDLFFKKFSFVKANANVEEFFTAFLRQTKHSFFFNSSNRKDFFLQTLTHLHSPQEIVRQAEAILRREFSFFGTTHRFPENIHWHLDFKSGKSFDSKSFYTDVRFPNHGSDVKTVWELSRCGWAWQLGKAYWLTNRRAYKDAFFDLIDSWSAENPCFYGTNWTCAMEVALRAANWLAGFYFFSNEHDEPNKWIAFLKMLFQHGRYIESNLEYTRRSGNHLISDAVGLFMLGCFFKHTPEGAAWLSLSKNILEEEILLQTYADGANYEMSLAYHRFVTELFLSAYQLGGLNRISFSAEFKARLEKSCEFMMHYIKPNGDAPLIGDSDDGRLFWFNLDDDFNNHTSVLSLAAVAFQRADFKAAARHFSEQALWLCGIDGWETFQKLGKRTDAPSSTLFRHSQFAILRSEKFHCFIDGGELGKRGWGGHGHNDTLSFELFAVDASFIVDSGTFCYTSHPARRREFRSMTAHNSVMIDGMEIAEFSDAFKVKTDKTSPNILKWISTTQRDELTVAHRAYQQLAQPIMHERTFILDKATHQLTISDRLYGMGTHSAEFFLHFAPLVTAERLGQSKLLLRHGESATKLLLEHDNADNAELLSYEFAPRYGVLLPAVFLRLKKSFTTELRFHFVITLATS